MSGIAGLVIREERAGDAEGIRALHRAAFGGEGEGRLVDGLREGGFVRVSLVAEVGGEIVGHVLFGRVSVRVDGGGVVEVVSLAPMAVRPGWQRRGIGSELVWEGLRLCRERGERAVVVLGHPRFYPRFGFSNEVVRGVREPYNGGTAWMGVELVEGSLRGVVGEVEYSAPFAAVS